MAIQIPDSLSSITSTATSSLSSVTSSIPSVSGVLGAVTPPSIPSISSLTSGLTLPGAGISIPSGFTLPSSLTSAISAATPPAFTDLMSAAKTGLTTALPTPSLNSIPAFTPPATPSLFADKSSTLNSITSSLKDGFGNLVSGASSAMASITGAINSAQQNALGDLAIAKAALAQKVKEATSNGLPVSQDNIKAALAPTTGLQNLTSSVSAAASDPFGAATKMASDQAAASAAKTDAINSLKADALLSLLTKPTPTSLAGAIASSINTSVFSSTAKYSVIKAQETSATQAVPSQNPPRDSVRPSGGPIPSDKPSIPITEPDIVTRIWTTELNGYNKAKEAAYAAALKILGLTSPPDPTQDAVTAAGVAFLDGIIPGYSSVKATSVAITSSKPDKTTWTDAEAAAVEAYTTNKTNIQTNPKFMPYSNALATFKKIQANYKIAYEAWKNNANRYTLPIDVENDLSYYDPDNMHGTSVTATKGAAGEIGYKFTYTTSNPITGYVRKSSFFGGPSYG